MTRPRTRVRLGSRKPRKDEGEKGKAVMGDESNGFSTNKAAGQEDEGNTVSFPEKVFTFGSCFVCLRSFCF